MIQWASKTQRRWTCVPLFGLWWPTWSLTWRKCSPDSESLINAWTNPCPSAYRSRSIKPLPWEFSISLMFFLWFDFIITSDTLLITPLSCSMYCYFDTCVIFFFNCLIILLECERVPIMSFLFVIYLLIWQISTHKQLIILKCTLKNYKDPASVTQIWRVLVSKFQWTVINSVMLLWCHFPWIGLIHQIIWLPLGN